MHSFRPRYMYWLSRAPVLAVYLLFFFVQLFYNLDVSARSTAGCFNRQCVYAAAHLSHNAKSCRENKPGHTKVRLNKRFQPAQFIMPAIPETVCVPVIFIPVTTGSYLPAPYTSAPIAAHSLRGPPVMA